MFTLGYSLDSNSESDFSELWVPIIGTPEAPETSKSPEITQKPIVHSVSYRANKLVTLLYDIGLIVYIVNNRALFSSY